MTRITATYDIETPVGLQQAAAVLAGEQSTGTFVRLAAETDALRDRAAAQIENITLTATSTTPALPTRTIGNQDERGLIPVSWPLANFGAS